MKHGNPNVAVLDKVCEDCEKTYTPRNSMSKRCDPCREVFYIRYNREWRVKNPTYHSDYNKQWRAEHADTYLEYHAQYRRENRDAVRERYNDWAQRNPDYATRWLESNRERARETVRRRRARLRAAETRVVTERDIRRLVQRYNASCAYCLSPLGSDYHIDHVMPVSLGGRNAIGNLLPSCATCNVSKSNWLLSEWRYRDRLSRPIQRRKPTHVRLEAA